MTKRQAQNWSVIFIIGAAIVLISALHFLTPLAALTAHQVYQRLYYLPIVAAALFFGWRGGAASALFATAAYVPHIALQWHHQPEYALNQYHEIVLFFSFGLVAGALSDRNRHERERATRINQELERSYAELRKTFEQLLQAERLTALGELSAGIVHEIRNPLASIKGAVEIIEDELAADSPRREFARIAKAEVERLNRIVGEFLNFARPKVLEKRETDVNELLRSVCLLVAKQAAAQNVEMLDELDENLPLVALDAEQIKQVLLNLTINALQAMPTGGKLICRTNRNDENIVVEIEDTGGGVKTTIMSNVFDPFFTTKEKGLGLGLSIAYKIATQHNGKLSVANNAQGAVFRLTLPA